MEDKGQPTPDRARIEAYNRVVSVAQLRSVQMTSSSFKVKPAFFSDESDRKLSYSVIQGEQHFSKEDASAMAFISFRVESKLRRKNTLLAEATYILTYDGLVDCEEEAVLAFLRRVTPFTSYPYFRSLVAAMDWAAMTGLPPLPIHKEPERKAARGGK